MAKILVVGLHASDDPTKATLPFITAIGAIGAETYKKVTRQLTDAECRRCELG